MNLGGRDPKHDEPAQSRFRWTDALEPLSQHGLLSVGRDLRINGCNEAAERLLGKASREMVNLSSDQLPSSIAALVDEAVRSGDPIRRRNVTIGSGGRVQVDIVLGRTGSGEIDHLVVGLVDVEGIARLEEQLWHLHRFANIGVLSTTVAHEIKNALAFVKTFTDLLAEEEAESERLKLARLEIQRIDNTARQLLRLSRGDQLELSRLNLHSVIENSLQLIQHRLDSHNITLVRSFESDVDQVDAREQQLELALINLYLNAIGAMSQGGELRLTTRKDASGSSIILTVEDTGSGISEADLPYLFDPFFTTKSDGSGLGLSITQCIIRHHGGSIWAESGPVSGAAFHVSLPLSR